MFLDPDPRRKNAGSSPFFSSHSPVVSPREEFEQVRERITRKRRPLHERTPSRHNERPRSRRSTESDAKPSVRLVRPSPAPSARKSIEPPADEHVRQKPAAAPAPAPVPVPARLSSSASVKPASVSEPGFQAASRVSDSQSTANWTPERDRSSNVTVLPQTSPEAVPKSPLQWPSTSSRFSTSSTLKGHDSAVNSWAASENDRSGRNSRAVRLSGGTTLQGTPEPFEHDLLKPLTDAESSGSTQVLHTLHTLQESSPEHSVSPDTSTVRVVQPSLKSSSSDLTTRLRRHASDSSLPRLSASPAASVSTPRPLQPRNSSRTSSTTSLPLPLTVRPVDPELRDQSSQDSFARAISAFPAPSSPIFVSYGGDSSRPPSSGRSQYDRPANPVLREQSSRDSFENSDFAILTSSPNFFAYSDSSRPVSRGSPHDRPTNPVLRDQSSQDSFARSFVYPLNSSPNFVAYTDSSRPVSPRQRLPHFASFESIQSRIESTSRPATARSRVSTRSRTSRHRSSSVDTLPPLQIPRKRLRHKKGSRSMDYEEVDTQPWPRQGFNSHLSTIASESTRSMSQQLSHFSLGSGVLTGDDSSSIPLSATVSRFSRRESAPVNSPSDSMPGQSTSSEEAGDMTMGLFRAESAKPEPLFRGRQMSGQDGRGRFDTSLPPIPPIPMTSYSDEHGDMLAELSAPPLRQKRSGYSVRNRSNSTPSGSHSRHNSQVSYDGSERWSHGSSIFPTWAKNYYGGNAALLSSSKVSLAMPPEPQRREMPHHARNLSQRTERSITSRLGTGYSEIETSSPLSSHFLPSIFRPRTRTRGGADVAHRSSKHSKKSKNSRPSNDDASRTDSMAIFSDPFPQDGNGETLPSGQPKWGALKDQSDAPPLPPLPRKYSKQKHWDNMSFPRPMTKDRLSDFGMDESAHLGPSKRQSQRLSAWRTPSFVESLDTLFKSRGNRQILFFAFGFIFPFAWMLGALLPLPPRPSRDAAEAEKQLGAAASEDDVHAALRRHEAGDASKRWAEERVWLKAKWWRTLNRVMCFVGLGVVAAVIALAVVATR